MKGIYANKFLSGKKILFFGDSIMGSDRYKNNKEESKGVPDLVADYTGATVINAGMPGTSISSLAAKLKPLSQEELIKRLTKKKDYFTGLEGFTDSSKYASGIVKGVQALLDYQNGKENPFDDISVIVLAHGTNDWTQNVFLHNETHYDYGRAITTVGVLEKLETNINKIQAAYPGMMILVLTPIWRYFGTNGKTNGDNYTGFGDGYTLKEWATEIEKLCKNKRIAVLNGYEKMQLSTNGYFFDKDDRTHLNYKGNQMYAALITEKLREMGLPPNETSDT